MPTFTLSQFEQRVFDRLEGNTAEFAEPQVRGVINEFLRRLNLLIGFSQNTVAVAGGTVAGQLEYAVPAQIILPMRVDYNGRELSPTPLSRLAQSYRDWATDTSADGPVSRVSRIGSRTFVIHPIDAIGGATLEVTGIASITPLVNPGDTVPIDDEWVDSGVDYCIPRLLLKEGGKPFADASLSRNHLVGKLRVATLWQRMQWPAYWVQAAPPNDGKGTGY